MAWIGHNKLRATQRLTCNFAVAPFKNTLSMILLVRIIFIWRRKYPLRSRTLISIYWLNEDGYIEWEWLVWFEAFGFHTRLIIVKYATYDDTIIDPKCLRIYRPADSLYKYHNIRNTAYMYTRRMQASISQKMPETLETSDGAMSCHNYKTHTSRDAQNIFRHNTTNHTHTH